MPDVAWEKGPCVLYMGDAARILEEYIEDLSVDCIITDPPYMMGVDWRIEGGNYIITNPGKLSLTFANPDMDGKWWHRFMNNVYRVLKHGGYALFFGIDRQCDIVTYYARANGLQVCQSLYWKYKGGWSKHVSVARKLLNRKKGRNLVRWMTNYRRAVYGASPFKPEIEPILIFRKPPKHGIINDIIAYHNKNKTEKGIRPAVIWGSKIPIPQVIEAKRGEGRDLYCEGLPVEEYCAQGNWGAKKKDYGRFIGKARNPHPTVKPISLMRALVDRFTREGEVVLDPFAGSGTTGIACVEKKRVFIGVEIEERWFNLSKHRLERVLEEVE